MSWPLATSGLPDLGGVYTGMGTTTGSTAGLGAAPAGPVTLAGTICGSSVRSTAGGAATGTVSAAGTPAAGRPAASGRGGPAAVPGRPGSAEGVSAGMGRVGSGVGVSVGMGRIASGTGARPAASGLGAAGRGPAAAASGAGGSGTTGRMTASGAGGLTAATGSRAGARLNMHAPLAAARMRRRPSRLIQDWHDTSLPGPYVPSALPTLGSRRRQGTLNRRRCRSRSPGVGGLLQAADVGAVHRCPLRLSWAAIRGVRRSMRLVERVVEGMLGPARSGLGRSRHAHPGRHWEGRLRRHWLPPAAGGRVTGA